jgi:hypothetical protein
MAERNLKVVVKSESASEASLGLATAAAIVDLVRSHFEHERYVEEARRRLTDVTLAATHPGDIGDAIPVALYAAYHEIRKAQAVLDDAASVAGRPQ